MQPEHDARGGDRERQRHEHEGGFGECRDGLPGEGDGVQRVARRKAVAVERRARERDARVADEGTLAHERALQQLVDGEARGAAREHDDRDLEAAFGIQEWQREHERVPNDAVTQAARGLEEHSHGGVADAAIQPATQPVLGVVEPRHERTHRGAVATHGPEKLEHAQVRRVTGV
jgi:hypothetical protein